MTVYVSVTLVIKVIFVMKKLLVLIIVLILIKGYVPLVENVYVTKITKD